MNVKLLRMQNNFPSSFKVNPEVSFHLKLNQCTPPGTQLQNAKQLLSENVEINMFKLFQYCSTASSIAQWQSAGFECRRSRVQSPRHTKDVIKNGTSSSLVQHSTLKRDMLALSQELRQENKCNGYNLRQKILRSRRSLAVVAGMKKNECPRRADKSRTLKKNKILFCVSCHVNIEHVIYLIQRKVYIPLRLSHFKSLAKWTMSESNPLVEKITSYQQQCPRPKMPFILKSKYGNTFPIWFPCEVRCML